MKTIFRCHSKLKASHDGPMVNRNPLHLRQSSLDSACGPHCALMALMLMGVVKRDEIEDQEDLRRSGNKALSKMWGRSAGFYFTGIRAKALQSVFDPFRDTLSSRLLRKNQRIEKCIQSLKDGGVCIVGIHNDDYSHWVLAVGFSSKGEFDTADTLLILDPDAPIIALTAWNGVLTIAPNRKEMHRYETADHRSTVVIDTVLALTPSLVEVEPKP